MLGLHPADVVAHDEQDVGLLLREGRLTPPASASIGAAMKTEKQFSQTHEVTPNRCNEIAVMSLRHGNARTQPGPGKEHVLPLTADVGY